jgi:prepilin-type processing-associated H-X9-DG protein
VKLVGTFPGNVPASVRTARGCSKPAPIIYGNYAKNEELIANYGYYRTSYSGYEHNEAQWETTADIIIIAESRSGSEDVPPDTNPFSANNGPYIEPGSTSWNEVFDQLSGRHNGGINCTFADGHAKWQRYEWFKTYEGRFAISPPMATAVARWTVNRRPAMAISRRIPDELALTENTGFDGDPPDSDGTEQLRGQAGSSPRRAASHHQ